MEFEGYLTSKLDDEKDLNIIIKVGPDQYQLHYVRLAPEITYLSQQLDITPSSPYYYKVSIFAPYPVVSNPEQEKNMKSFLTRFGIILLTFLSTMAVAFLAISPIIGLLYAAQYIGYWFYVLLPVALAFAIALIWSIIVYIAKKKDKYCN